MASTSTTMVLALRTLGGRSSGTIGRSLTTVSSPRPWTRRARTTTPCLSRRRSGVSKKNTWRIWASRGSMPSAATMERRWESGTVSFSSTLSAWLVSASMSSSWASVSRWGRLVAAGMTAPFWMVLAQLGRRGVIGHHPQGVNWPAGRSSRPGQAPHLEQLQAEQPDPGQHAVQGRLVGQPAPDGGAGPVGVDLHLHLQLLLERGQDLVAGPAPDPERVPCRTHAPHPSPPATGRRCAVASRVDRPAAAGITRSG